jgi:hypothetical protein
MGGWLTAHHLTYWLAYQPASRYLLFQFAELAVLALATGLLGLLILRMVRRDA